MTQRKTVRPAIASLVSIGDGEVCNVVTGARSALPERQDAEIWAACVVKAFGCEMVARSRNTQIDGLVAAIAAGDRAAFEALYKMLEMPLYRFILLRLNDPHRSADIIHEVFLEVWRSAAAFRGQSSARTWIFAIAWRKVMDAFRQGKRVTYQENVPEQIDEGIDAESAVSAAEDSRIVRSCLGSLKAEHRVAIELTFFEEMSYHEIAAIVGVPEGTVKSRVYHAKQLMLRCLSANGLVRGEKGNG